MARENGQQLANLNLKVTEDERWAFKELCVRHRLSQVDGFRLAVRLMTEHFNDQDKADQSDQTS